MVVAFYCNRFLFLNLHKYLLECFQRYRDGCIQEESGAKDSFEDSEVSESVGERAPNVFICYINEDEEHMQCIRSFIDDIRNMGINATCDIYDLVASKNMAYYIVTNLSRVDYVLVVCSKSMKLVQKCISSGRDNPRQGMLILFSLLKAHLQFSTLLSHSDVSYSHIQ